MLSNHAFQSPELGFRAFFFECLKRLRVVSGAARAVDKRPAQHHYRRTFGIEDGFCGIMPALHHAGVTHVPVAALDGSKPVKKSHFASKKSFFENYAEGQALISSAQLALA
jgi:hypothetical protein